MVPRTQQGRLAKLAFFLVPVCATILSAAYVLATLPSYARISPPPFVDDLGRSHDPVSGD